MTWENKYKTKLNVLIQDPSVCRRNRQLFKTFFEKEEYKLKRINGLQVLDESCYMTLYGYILKFGNVNKWFRNTPLDQITKDDFQRVYDGLEDGTILNARGRPFKDKEGFYSRVFRSTFFEMIGKDNIVKKVMEFHQSNKKQEVRFAPEAEIRQIAGVIVNPRHKLLAWMAFDIGENVNALLQLRKSDCLRQADPDTQMPEYRINLRKETLKRSRRERSEITNCQETVELLDIILKNLGDDEPLFTFEYRNAKKFLDRAVRIVGAKCTPGGQPVTWKDLRSSMACDLLNKGWTCDEVNARLGHCPSSKEIDRYVNFLALDRHKPKRKVYQHNLAKLQNELDESKRREALNSDRLGRLQQEMLEIKKLMALRGLK